MTKETFLKALELMGKITTRKGIITTLTQKVNNPRYILQKDELEKRIIENITLLSNLKKEFADL